MKGIWEDLKAAPPGERFTRHYFSNRDQPRRAARRVMRFVAGAALFAVGLLLVVTPGPGMVVLALGGALLAEQSLAMARLLDWAEARIRRAISPLQKKV